MPFPTPGNLTTPLLPPSILQRGQDWLLRQWGNRLKDSPWAVQPGLQPIPHQYPQNPYGMLAPQPVADIYSFTKKGLLGNPGPEMGGRRGMLGGGRYNFRDPSSVRQYEADHGLKPGSLKPVEAERGTTVPFNERLYQAEQKKIAPGYRDADFGFVGGPKDFSLTPGPTPAQMARPVKQTPEISAKLAEARAERAKRGELGSSISGPLAKGLIKKMGIPKDIKPETLSPQRQAELNAQQKTLDMRQTLKNMSEGLWKKMSVLDRQRWIRDSGFSSWPVDVQRTFIERFMPKGIGP